MSVIIKKIEWDNIYLFIQTSSNLQGEIKYFLRERKSGQKIQLAEEEGSVKINITNVSEQDENFMLDTGVYEFVYEYDDEIHLMSLAQEQYSNIESLDKIFPYKQGNYAYLVKLEAVEEEQMGLSLSVCYMMKNKKPKSRWSFWKCMPFKTCLKNTLVQVIVSIFRAEYFVLSHIYKKENTILLMSETKNKLSGNLQAIDSRMKKDGWDQKWKVSYSFCEILNCSTLKTGLYWLRTIPLLAKQKVILVDDYCPTFKYFNLSKDTKLIQVWHAGVGFKSVGYSRFGKKDSPDPIESCHRKYDYVVVGSKKLIPVYQEVFGLPADRFLPFGMARTDEYISELKNSQFRNDFFAQHSDWKEKEIILFAPTYRGGGQAEAYYPYEKLDLEKINQLCGNDRLFLFKMHPFIKELPKIPGEFKNRIIDVSDQDMNNMLQICDVLITDYSSVIYEFALNHKPIIFYAYDKDIYKMTRGFHWDFEKYAPGEICTTFDELMEILSEKKYSFDKIEEFVDFGYGFIDQDSSKRFIEFIDHLIKKDS